MTNTAKTLVVAVVCGWVASSDAGPPTYYGHGHGAYVPLVRLVDRNPRYFWDVDDYGKQVNDAEVLQQNAYLMQLLAGAVTPGANAPSARADANQMGGSLPRPVGRAGASAGGIAAVLETHCTRCHGGALGKKGNVDLSNPSQVDFETALLCYGEVSAGTMPEGGAPLPKEARREFVKWIAQLKGR